MFDVTHWHQRCHTNYSLLMSQHSEDSNTQPKHVIHSKMQLVFYFPATPSSFKRAMYDGGIVCKYWYKLLFFFFNQGNESFFESNLLVSTGFGPYEKCWAEVVERTSRSPEAACFCWEIDSWFGNATWMLLALPLWNIGQCLIIYQVLKLRGEYIPKN